MLEKVLTFLLLGYFVFVADTQLWWSTSSLADWYSHFGLWALLIAAAYAANRQKRRGGDL